MPVAIGAIVSVISYSVCIVPANKFYFLIVQLVKQWALSHPSSYLIYRAIVTMDSDDGGEPSPPAETGRPSLFGAVMAGQNRRKRGVGHNCHDNVAVSDDTGDDDFVGRGAGSMS